MLRLFRKTAVLHTACSSHRRFRPALDVLEDRLAPAVFNASASAPDGAPGSLRAAVIAANGNGQDNVINLQAGLYRLTIPNASGQQENAAATGDLDLTAAGCTPAPSAAWT